MSEQATEPEVVELPAGDAAFGALMDALAPEPEAGAQAAGAGAADSPAAAAGDAAAGTGAAEAGSAAADGSGQAAAPAAAAEPAADKPGEPAAGGTGAEPGAGAESGAGSVDAATLIPQLGELSNKIEQKVIDDHLAAARDEVKAEHAQYFQALEKHPRLLVGMSVPRAGGEGMEVLKSAEDAASWQEAVKSLLVEEIQSRATAAMETQTAFLETVSNSVKLFQDNPDLIPNTKQFDRELADRFAKLAQPYEVRVEGKLRGYAIPVQPLVESLRTTLVAERSAKAAAPPAAAAAPAAAAPAAPVPPAPEDLPQEGIPNKSGSGTGEAAEEFSALFGTIGLPNFRI